MKDKTLKDIKTIIQEYLPSAKVLLFGSRARGDYRPKSDYDLLIITKKTYPIKQKISLTSRIHKAIVKKLRIYLDITLNSQEEVDYKKNLKGHLIRMAVREAKPL